MADISKIKLPNNETYDFKDSAGRKEAYLEWGGKNFSASYGCIDAAMIGNLGANRFAFLKAAGLTIEYSNDGGSTWTDYGAADASKVGLFARGTNFYLGNHSSAGTSTVNDQLRVTIATSAAGLYTVLNKIVIYMSTMGNTVQVKMERALESTPTTYITHLDWTGISGWSGYNVLNISNVTTYGNTPGTQNGRLRFIFRQTAVNSGSYGAACISRIMGFGGVGWTVPSNMASDGHLYYYDNNQNATFPAMVTATRFVGPADTVRDSGNGANTYLAYSKSGLTSTSCFAAWNGYELRAISPQNTANVSLTSLSAATADPTDTTELIRRDTAGANTFYRVTFSTVWNYILSKIKSVVLSTSTSSTSTTTAATSSAVKTAYDLANDAKGIANEAKSGVNGTLIYDHTYTISNGTATFTAHVYCKGAEVTSSYADSCFSWSYKLADSVTGTPTVVSLGTGKTKTITISTLGYGGYVLGTFTPPA